MYEYKFFWRDDRSVAHSTPNYGKNHRFKGEAMIGTSVSFCVQDIASGKVAIENVEKIIGGTSVSTEADIDHLLSVYRQSYWSKFPEEAEQIFRQLYTKGKIEQPRLVNPEHFPRIPDGHWVENEAEIVWNDKWYILWCSLDGQRSWEEMGRDRDKCALIRQRQEAVHNGADSVADLMILPEDEVPQTMS